MTDYKRRINKLIPEAEEIAEKEARKHYRRFELRDGVRGSVYTHCFKSELFHAAMDRLAKEAGLR